MTLYNIHTHLQSFSQINGYNIEYILNTYPFQFEDIKKKQPSAQYFSCGVHPWYSDDFENQLDVLEKIVRYNSDIVAVGEAGLDKLKGLDMSTQIDIFKRQIQLAEMVEKPLVIHCVKAWNELIALKKEINPKQSWIIHGYRGNINQVEQLVKFGFKFSLGEYSNSEILKEIPMSSLFFETDMSDSSIFTIYQKYSELIGISVKDLVALVSVNVKNTFKL
jgi:TatD DNase family protein